MNTNRRRSLKGISARVRKIREVLSYSQDSMAAHFGVARASYYRYESGEALPGPYALDVLANNFDVSLDWLIAGKGPMFYKEKKRPEEKIKLENALDEVKELLDHMDRIPLLRLEVLSFYYKFKRDYKDLIETPAQDVNPEKE